MPASLDVEDFFLCDHRPAVFVGNGQRCKTGENIETCHNPAVGLDGRDVFLDLRHKLGINPGLDGVDPVFGTQDLLFIFLEFFRNIPLSIDM